MISGCRRKRAIAGVMRSVFWMRTQLSQTVERNRVDLSIFHDARYQGICEAASAAAVRESKGIPEGANPFDYFGALELSVHEFQMNLAADVIGREGIKNEAHATRRNYRV